MSFLTIGLGVISKTVLLLLLGVTVPAFAQEAPHEQEAKPAQQEKQAKPAQQEKQAKPMIGPTPVG